MTVNDELNTEVEQLNTEAEQSTTEGAEAPETGVKDAVEGTKNPPGDAAKGTEEEVLPPGAKEKLAQDPEAGKSPTAFTPNLKYRVIDYSTGQKKDFEIDKSFASLMKDPESEKKVRELHEKATGLDALKPRFNEIRDERNTFERENTEIRGSIDDLRKTYNGAVSSGNLLKLDAFFDKLRVPHDVVMQYAIAKAQLQEMPPEQRQMILSQIDAEKKAESAEMEKATYQQQMQQITHQNRKIMLDQALSSQAVAPLAETFDSVRSPGAFVAEVVRVGKLAWFESNGTVDLTPDQAIQQVIKLHRLSASAPAQTAPGTSAPGTKAPVTRTTQTIPNVAGRSSSPLKNKPKSIEDLKALYKQHSDQSA